MGFLSSIGSFLGNLFGGDSDEEKKKKQQQQQQAANRPAPGPSVAVSRPNADNTALSVAPAPTNSVNLVVPGQEPLKKVNPTTLSLAQQRSKAFLDANGGPVDPNYKSKQPSAGDIALEAVKGIGHTIVDPAVHSFNEMQTKNATLQKASKPGLVNNLKTTAEQTGNFVKAIGQTGAEYSAYAAPEIKALKVAADAPLLVKAGMGLVKHGATSAPLSVASDLASGERDPTKIAANAGLSTLVSGAGGALSNLRKAPIAPATDNLAKAVDEVAPGVRSSNPSKEVDAAAQAEQQAIKEAEQTRAAQMAEEPKTPSVAARASSVATPPTGPVEIKPDVLSAPEVETLNTLNTAAKERVLSNDEKALRTNLQEKKAVIDSANNPKPTIAPPAKAPEADPRVASSAPVDATPAAVTPDLPVANPLVPAPATAIDEAPLQTSGDIAPAVPAPESVAPPVMPESAAQPTADVAPLSHDALVKQLGPAGSDLKGSYSKRIPVNIEEMKQNAAGVIANMDDQSLLKAFSTTGPDTMIKDSQSFSLARAALDRVSQLSDDPAAVQVTSNILDALDRYVSKSGEGLRIAQEAFDTMPLPMKVRYIVKKIDAANVDTKNYQALADDPAKAAIVEANITGHLQASQAITEKAAALQGQLNEIVDAVKNGLPAPADPKPLAKELKNLQRDLAANNGELVKYYGDLVPGRSKGQKALVDWPRQMMLSSFTSRINDIITTSANIGNLSLQNITQGVLSKVVNAFSPGKVTDTLRGGSKIFTGGANELKKTVGEVQGKQYTDDLAGSLKTNVEQRSGLQKARGLVGRTIQAATEAATNLSAGVRDQRLYQLASQEAEQAGLKGSARKDYAEARAAVPTRQMQEQADRLHMELNNLQENPVTRTLNRVASAIQGDSAIGGFLKNQVMPFTSWLGGNIYNTLTDKNVVASFVKTMDSARKGDAEGVVRNLSKFANNSAQTYALGYLLTQSGIITNENAEGYNDAGAYFHIGDRYIPVGFAGFFAPNIILGNAAYHGLNTENGSPADGIATFAGDAVLNLAKSVNLAGSLGADNNLTRSYDALTAPGGGAGDAAATLAAGATGQFIPALSGDANAVLNNGVPFVPGSDGLNPTHERADTKVVDPNSPSGTAKDVPKSAVAGLVNRVPVASQLALPRKADVAAPDLVDRTTKGDRETPGGAAAKAKVKTAADQAKDFKARGIPDPTAENFDDAVKSRVESGKFDAAIEGLQAKLTENQKNKDIPPSKNKEIEDQIKTLKVTKDGKYDAKVIEQYKKTSLSEWRDMGDPESDNYDPETYKLLYNYDKDLAGAGVSRNSTKTTEPLYSAKKPGEGRGSAASKELSRIKSNTIGNTPTLGKVSLGDLSPQKAGSIKLPTIQQVKAGELIKKRQISVRKA